MIGQVSLLKKLDRFNLDNFPHTVLLNGEPGCGKHLYCSLISEKLNIELVDITKSISLDLITDIILSNSIGIYLIDTDLITEKTENVILKFIEEPLKNCYIILLSSNKDSLLPTIRNRCRIIDFEPYTKTELSSFKATEVDDIILDICKTPGQVISLSNSDNLTKSFDLAKKLVDKFSVASYGNILNISNSISFKKEEDKLDYDCFCSCLIYIITQKILEDPDNKYIGLYNLTDELIKNNKIPNLNKQYLFEKYLFDIKSLGRCI